MLKMAEQKKRVTNHQVILVAGAVRADPKTVRRVVDGKPVRGSVADAISEELKRRGWR